MLLIGLRGGHDFPSFAENGKKTTSNFVSKRSKIAKKKSGFKEKSLSGRDIYTVKNNS